jgi:hypothetical protein
MSGFEPAGQAQLDAREEAACALLLAADRGDAAAFRRALAMEGADISYPYSVRQGAWLVF